jgi:succinyl-CoA synthetase beta subunit
MNLHEYQAKSLFEAFGLPVPPGIVIENLKEVEDAVAHLGGSAWMMKAQVHAGGRGKAGGVRYVTDLKELQRIVGSLLGTHLVTYQTDSRGQPVNKILITSPCDIKQELYLSAVLDRSTRRIVIMASTEGGVDIEEVAKESPEKIFKTAVDPLLGLMPWQARLLGFQLELTPSQIKAFSKIVMGLSKLFIEKDLSLVEINPLIIDKADELICLDAKIVTDDNALFRQPALAALRDPTQEDPRENRAREWELNYISLEGNIGCIVNGAGLAMATMDLIKLHGGSPANFLDVGGSATKERVTEAFKIILSDTQVKGILVNIFGGIVRCDMIAEGIISAMKAAEVTVPVVVRLVGNNADKGLALLNQSQLNLIAADDLNQAADQIVKAVSERV